MHDVIRKMPWREAHLHEADPELFLTREWLLTNGLGGYASGTISGILTRRYHGLLIASLPAPLGRIVMLSQLAEILQISRWGDGADQRRFGHGERQGTPCRNISDSISP